MNNDPWRGGVEMSPRGLCPWGGSWLKTSVATLLDSPWHLCRDHVSPRLLPASVKAWRRQDPRPLLQAVGPLSQVTLAWGLPISLAELSSQICCDGSSSSQTSFLPRLLSLMSDLHGGWRLSPCLCPLILLNPTEAFSSANHLHIQLGLGVYFSEDPEHPQLLLPAWTLMALCRVEILLLRSS